jgi:hypothetical protein
MLLLHQDLIVAVTFGIYKLDSKLALCYWEEILIGNYFLIWRAEGPRLKNRPNNSYSE